MHNETDPEPQQRATDSTGLLRADTYRLSDGSIALALYNEDDHPKTIGVSFTSLGWTAATKARVRNLWKKADEPVAVGAVPPRLVEPHGTVLLRLTKV